jgi:hypothetical protein
MITQEELDEAILGLMGSPNWDLIAKFLVDEAITARDQCADATTWDEVNKLAGFAEGIAYVVNLRDITERALEERNANV